MIEVLSSWWTLGGIAAFVTAGFALMLTPLGAPMLSAVLAFAETKAGRWIIAGFVGLLGLIVTLAKARQEGRDEANAAVKQANAEAIRSKSDIDAKVAAEPAATKRAELEKWGKP